MPTRSSTPSACACARFLSSPSASSAHSGENQLRPCGLDPTGLLEDAPQDNPIEHNLLLKSKTEISLAGPGAGAPANIGRYPPDEQTKRPGGSAHRPGS